MPRYHGSAVSICFCLGTPEITPMCIGETATSWVYQRCWHVDHMFSTVFILQTWYFCWAWPLDLLLIPLRGDIWFLWAWPCEFDFKRLQQTWLTIEWDAGCLDISWHILTSQNCFLSAVYSIHPFNILFPLFKAVSEEPWSHLEPWRPWRCCQPRDWAAVDSRGLTLNHVEPRLNHGRTTVVGRQQASGVCRGLGRQGGDGALSRPFQTLQHFGHHCITYIHIWYPLISKIADICAMWVLGCCSSAGEGSQKDGYVSGKATEICACRCFRENQWFWVFSNFETLILVS